MTFGPLGPVLLSGSRHASIKPESVLGSQFFFTNIDSPTQGETLLLEGNLTVALQNPFVRFFSSAMALFCVDYVGMFYMCVFILFYRVRDLRVSFFSY